MTTFLPTSSACHLLQLPPTEKDDRLNLNVRTGSALILHHSMVFTFGGLTVGLDLNTNVHVQNILKTFLLRLGPNKLKKIRKYLSGELFYLNLLSKTWFRVNIQELAPRPKPRLFHEMARGNNCIYVFGGLVFPEDGDELTDEKASRLVPATISGSSTCGPKAGLYFTMARASNWRPTFLCRGTVIRLRKSTVFILLERKTTVA